MSEGRQRLKQKRYEEELERQRKQLLEEETRLYVSCFNLFSLIEITLLHIYAS